MSNKKFLFSKLVDAPSEVKELLAGLIASTSDCYLRGQFEKAGIKTAEKMARHPAEDYEMESLPVIERVKHYLETIDWSDEHDVMRLRPFVFRSLREAKYNSEVIIDNLTDMGVVTTD